MSGLQADFVFSDITPPQLLSYEFNLTSEVLILSFSETMNSTSLDVSSIELLNSAPRTSLTTTYSLSSSRVISNDSTTIQISLSTIDLNAIKMQSDLAVSQNSLFIVIGSGGILDMNNNGLLEQTPLSPASYFEDLISPTLKDFNLDLNTGELTLVFDETVNGSTLRPSEIFLHNSASNATSSFQLTGPSFVTNNFTTTISINIVDSDLNEIKRLRYLGTNSSDTYISFNQNLVQDMNFNNIIPISELDAKPVLTYISDTTPPILQSFELNLTSEILFLSFSETVQVDTLNLRHIAIQNEVANTDMAFVTLTGGHILSNDSTDVEILLTLEDLNAIKERTEVATNQSNTYITIANMTIRDMNDNWNTPIQAIPLRASVFFEDIIDPVLDFYNLDMNKGLLTLFFSESVNAASLQVSQIQLLMSRGSLDMVYTLSTSSFSNSSNGPVIVVQISTADLNGIKRVEQLAVGESTTYISITTDLVDDMNNNAVASIVSMEAQRVTNFTRDTTNVTIDAYTLDLTREELILTFSETVQARSIRRTFFRIQNFSDGQSYVTLEPYPIEFENYDVVITVPLQTPVLNQVKKMTELATSRNNTWLAVMTGGILDTFDNPLEEISSTNAQQAAQFIPDLVRPQIVDVALDLDIGKLILTFDETVRADSLNVSQITLQNEVNNSSSTYTLTNSHGSSEDSTIITIYLSFYDLNQIKLIRNLASIDEPFEYLDYQNSSNANGNTFLVTTAEVIQDMNFNPVIEINSSNAKPIFNLTLDTTPPQLVSFSFNLNTEQVILTFDEALDVLTLVYSEISFFGYSTSDNYTLTGGSTPSDDGHILVVQLAIDDVNNIKRIRNLAISNSSVFISLSNETIMDMNSNPLNFSGLQNVDTFTADSISPILVSFDLNLTSELLVLTFNETIRADSVDVTEITLQNFANLNDTESDLTISLESGIVLLRDDPIIVITLLSNDTNSIKRSVNLATSQNNTFLSITNLTLTDMNNNSVSPILMSEAVQVSEFTEDRVDPTLLYFSFDLTREILSLIFSETVNINSFDISALVLVDPDNRSMYRLTGGVIEIEKNSTSFNVILSTLDLNEVKKLESIATSIENTFIGFGSDLILDMNNNHVIPQENVQAIRYMEDRVKPALVCFHLDMNEGLLFLTFSETVRSSTFQSDGIVLQNSHNASNFDVSNYTLQYSLSQSTNQPIITVYIPDTDLNEIKRIPDLAIDINSTNIALQPSAINDMNNNSVMEILTTQAQQAKQFTEDLTNPSLIDFSLDMDNGVLWLTFNETMLISSLDSSFIRLINSKEVNDNSTLYRLINSSALNGYSDDPIIPIELGRIDLNEIKRLSLLATDINNTFILIESEAITDMNFNPVYNITIPQQVTNYTADHTRPELEEYFVNMDTTTLVFVFSETVNISTFQVIQITLQDSMLSSGPILSLSNSSYTQGSDSHAITVFISQEDTNTLTALTNMYNSAMDSFVRLTNYTVIDMNGNTIVPIDDGMAKMADDYVFDTTNTTLIDFMVDLDNFTVTLIFDETISSETIDYTKFHAFSNIMGTINFTLTNGSVNLPYTNELVLSLLESDVCGLKLTERLWTNENDTWLFAEAGAIYDWTMMNPLNEALLKSDEGPIEIVPPTLTSFSVDLTSGIVTLNFDEPVRVLTIQWRYIYLQDTPDSSHTYSYRLRGGTALSPNGKQIMFRFTTRDLNIIKSLTGLYTNENTTYLSLQRGTVLDMVGNPSSPIDGLAVDIYMEDVNAPFLVEYSIDMNSGELYLTFSETVDVSSINTSAITLQYDSNVSYSNPMAFHTFASNMTIAITSDMENMLDNKIVIIDIARDDLNEVKRKTIANSRARTWLTLQGGSLTDNNFRNVIEIRNGYAKQAVNYTDDETDPVLESYQISLNEGFIRLFFSETVDVTTLNVAQIALFNARSTDQATEFYVLTNSSVHRPENLSIDCPDRQFDIMSGSGMGSGEFNISGVSVSGSASGINMDMFSSLSSFNSPIVKLYFSHFDLNVIKASTGLAVSASTTYIGFQNYSIADMVGNFLRETNTSDLYAPSKYTMDTISPALRRFSFDLNEGVFFLTFTETVNISSIDVTQITLISSVCTGANFTLNAVPAYPNTSLAVGPDWPVVSVLIGHEDLDAIKNMQSLFTGSLDSSLYLTDLTLRDNAGNMIVPISSCKAPRVRQFVPDITPPQLMSFDLDLNDGRLILTFSETVQIVDSLNVSRLTLESQPNSVESYTLTNYGAFRSNSIDPDNRVVTIMIGFNDLNLIKYNTELAVSHATTFLVIENGTVEDHSNNEVTSSILPVRIFTPDVTSPVLLNYTLDMDSTTLFLTFNETVNASSLRVEEITLQNNVQSLTDYHSSPLILTPGRDQTYTSSDNNYTITIHLGPIDRNEIKKRRNLAVSNSTTYLRLTQYSILDMNNNYVVPIEDGSAQQVSSYFEDSTPPMLTNFTMDMNLGHIVLTFDETIMAASLMVDAFALQDSFDDPMESLQLSLNGRRSAVDSTVLTIFIDILDLNEVKRLMICREIDTCFMSFEEGAVADMVDILIDSSNSSIQAANYVPDVNRPALVQFDTNLTSEIITLTFNETVDASSINFTAIHFQDFFEGTTSTTLSNGTLLSNDSTVIEFLLDLDDLNTIKRNTDLAVNRFSTWITIDQYAIQDLATVPNYVLPIVNTTDLTQGLVTTKFYPDLVPPEVLDFDLNLTSNDLTIYFSETVLARTFNVSSITLQSTEILSNSTESYRLQSGDLPLYSTLASDSTTDFHILTVKLGNIDTNAIKTLSNLATKSSNTFLSITSDLVQDMNMNSILPLLMTQATRARYYTQDEIRPDLLRFGLDLDAGQLLLTFSETVNASSFLLEHISIQSMSNSTISWSLTPQLIANITESSTVAVEIQPMSNFSSEIGSAFSSGSAFDNESNSSSGSGMQNIDLSTGDIAENSTELPDPFAPYYSFVNGTNSHVIVIQLGFTDLNQLKRLTDTATEVSDTYISIAPEALSDMNDNMVNPISTSSAKIADYVIPDTTPPALVFFSLNLTSEILSLTFTEVVNASSLQINAITLQESSLTHMVMIVSRYMLSGGNGSSSNDYIINIQLLDEDLNQLKKLDRIATALNDTYITVTSSLISDMSGNQVQDIVDGFGLQVSMFYNDFVRPILDSFSFDANTGLLHLTFSETVDAASFNVTHIVLQDGPTNLMNRVLQLSADSRLDMIYNDPTLTIELGECDLNFIKATEMFGLGIDDTYIVISEKLVTDINGNFLEPILEGHAMRASNYTPDTTRPVLIDYHLDFIAENMILNFDEPMNVSMVNFTSITLQDGVSSVDSYTLTGGNVTAFNKSLTLVISFDDVDIAFFKAHSSLTTSVSDTYITFTSDAFYDLATYPNPVHAILGRNATQVSSFIYYSPPVFNSIKPIAGRQSGGTLFQIDGGNFGDFFGEPGFREIDVLFDNIKAINTSILKFNVSIDGFTPPAGNNVGLPILLTITIDNSALMINVSGVFRYLAPPTIDRILPVTGSRYGNRLITIIGNNFGPPSYLDGPSVTVYLSGNSCLNITVINDTIITCISPVLPPQAYDLTVTVDEVPVTLIEGYSTIEPPTVSSVSPNTTFRFTPTEITITGNGFGPTTDSGNAISIQVYLISDFNTTECTNVTVTVEHSLLTCVAQPNLGPSQLVVVVDRESSTNNITFTHYDNAGSFSFEKSLFSVSERERYINVSVIRHNFSLYPSPASVSIQALDGTAKSGSHFIATNQTAYLTADETVAIFQIQIIYQDFEQHLLRKGEEDDVEINLVITDVTALHGDAYIVNSTSIVQIKAICEVVSHLCVANWNVIDSNVIYYRIEELP